MRDLPPFFSMPNPAVKPTLVKKTFINTLCSVVSTESCSTPV